MCGGQGTRLDAAVEKPLFEIDGVPLVDAVLDALAASRVERVYAAVSPHTPETAAHLATRDIEVLETPGDGYVEDLQAALAAIEPPVLTVAADLPLLTGATVDRVLDAYDGASVQVCVPAALKRQLGVTADATYERDGREVAPTGINVVADSDSETMFLTYDARYAVNVNRLEDAAVAEALR
jgi:adenosylcobinamide-phosphate guanylyltransferase